MRAMTDAKDPVNPRSPERGFPGAQVERFGAIRPVPWVGWRRHAIAITPGGIARYGARLLLLVTLGVRFTGSTRHAGVRTMVHQAISRSVQAWQRAKIRPTIFSALFASWSRFL
jgi:hypothetical protein